MVKTQVNLRYPSGYHGHLHPTLVGRTGRDEYGLCCGKRQTKSDQGRKALVGESVYTPSRRTLLMEKKPQLWKPLFLFYRWELAVPKPHSFKMVVVFFFNVDTSLIPEFKKMLSDFLMCYTNGHSILWKTENADLLKDLIITVL